MSDFDRAAHDIARMVAAMGDNETLPIPLRKAALEYAQHLDDVDDSPGSEVYPTQP